MTAAALRRLRSSTATHYDSDTAPTVTVMHRTPRGVVSTTGRMIAETQREVALLVDGSPVIVSTSTITRRTPHSTMAVTPST